MASSDTMIAVVFGGPLQVSIEQRPIPILQDDRDIIVKVHASGLCGSELHVYRGHQPSETGFVMGHEFTGVVTKKGAAVKTVEIGDKVVSPFTVSCMECFYCLNGYTSRCEHSLLFGSGALDGGQAEYVRVPWADGTVIKAPDSISDKALVLMADIWPTGFFGASNGFKMLEGKDPTALTVVVIGCGPVGLCAIISALDYRPKYLFAIDGVESRLQLAEKLGAMPLNYKLGPDEMSKQIKDATNGRGADIVIEVVGQSAALRTAFDLVRPFGVISSIGVHNCEIPWSGSEGYQKNLRLQMGRCPVRSIFPEALAKLEEKQESLRLVTVPTTEKFDSYRQPCTTNLLVSFMFDKMMPLSAAVEGYDLFNKMQVQKVIFTM